MKTEKKPKKPKTYRGSPFEVRTWCEDCIGEKRHCPYDGKHPDEKVDEGKV
jgi:hypothetical protein